MIRHVILTVIVTTMLVTAGCATQVGPGEDGGPDTDADGGPDTDAATSTATDAGSGAQTSGKVSVYVSDEPNAIGDFEHLNVTITKVGLHRTNESGGGEWVEQSVDNRTIDLTNYLGANATKLTDVPAPNGTYDKVFVYVDEVDGTLENGEQVNVKLPSNKLHINAEFTVGDGEQVDFVYDITVFEAGNSGKYILKPVVSESGTSDQVDIEKPDEADERRGDDSEADDQSKDAELNVSLDGSAIAGENVTVTVTQNGSAVANATVSANGEVVGVTGSDGTLAVPVPADAEELELEVEHEDGEGELSVEVTAENDSDGADANGSDETDGDADAGGNADATPTETETGSLAAPPL